MSSKIEKKKSQIPISYQNIYLKAVTGKASPRQTIKAFCLECVGWAKNEITMCTGTDCPLYRYRPYRNAVESSSGVLYEATIDEPAKIAPEQG